MVTVYILEGSFLFEGSDVLGVYSSFEAAQSARDVYIDRVNKDTDLNDYDAYDIHCFVLDTPV